jgi:hypothetical protein
MTKSKIDVPTVEEKISRQKSSLLILISSFDSAITFPRFYIQMLINKG